MTVLDRPIGDLLHSGCLLAADRVRAFWRIVFSCLLVFVVGVFLAVPVYEVGVNDVPSSLRALVLVLWLLVLAAVIRRLTEERQREKLLEGLMRDGDHGWLAPLLLAAVIFFFAATGFAAVTQLLQAGGTVDLRKPDCAGCALDWEDFYNFYTWHFLEAIPLLEITDTLHWEAPLVYEGAGPGWLVLGLQVSVILPLIQTIRSWWRLRSSMPRLRLDARPRVVRAGDPVTVSWAPDAPPPGHVFDVYLAAPQGAGGPPTQLATAVEWVVQQVVAADPQREATEGPSGGVPEGGGRAGGPPHGEDVRTSSIAAVRDRLTEVGEAPAAETLTDEQVMDAITGHVVAGPGFNLWQAGVTERSRSFTPSAQGRYRFQARWRKTTEAHVHASKTPRTVAIVVGPPRTTGERPPDDHA